jgi:hypothetical protein
MRGQCSEADMPRGYPVETVKKMSCGKRAYWESGSEELESVEIST